MGTAAGNRSFCGQWNTGARIVLLVVMWWGRERGLPVGLDHAINLPEVDREGRLEEQDHEGRVSMQGERPHQD